MKKNKLMRLASVLLVLTLLSTSVIGGTFAKYITSDSANDTARVAKFGVVATVTGDLFAKSYKGVEATPTPADNLAQTWGVNKHTVSADGASVTAAAKLVAPGTKSDPAKPLTFNFKGTPEVSTTVAFDRAYTDTGIDANLYPATVELKSDTNGYGVMVPYTGTITADTITNYYTKSDETFTKVAAAAEPASGTTYYELHDATGAIATNYLPIVWKYDVSGVLNGVTLAAGTTPAAISATTTRDLKAMFTGIQGVFNGQNNEPNKANDLTATLGWEWNFEDDDLSSTAVDGTRTPTGSIYSAADRSDTILGDMMALGETNATGVINTDQYVVKMTSATAATVVKTITVKVVTASDAENTVTVAYTGEAPTTAYTASILDATPGTMSTNVCAVLGVAFNARITVTQVD